MPGTERRSTGAQSTANVVPDEKNSPLSRGIFLVSAAVGVTAVCAGLVVAFYMDLPPGPVSVALLALTVVAAAIISRWQA